MKHESTECQVAFCKDCWQIIKGNIKGVMAVADTLRQVQVNDMQPSDSEAKNG